MTRISSPLVFLCLLPLNAGCSGRTSSADTATPSTVGRQVPSPPDSSAPPRHNHRPGPNGPVGATRFGQQTKTSGCQPRGTRPDAGCTPGSIITQATTGRICVRGYTQGVRNVPESLKAVVYAEYGITGHDSGQYEIDHLVALELGGSNSIANLWPEAAPGFHQKDAVETELHDAVCSGTMRQRTAQVRIARDWRRAGVNVPSAGSGSISTFPLRHRPSPPASSGSDASFCATHSCITSFADGKGSIVQCADGEWSHSGGLSGVCSRHGGPKG